MYQIGGASMYKIILALIALSTATGGGLYYHDRTKLNGLQCEVVDTETQYGSSSGKTVNAKPAATWLIELSNSQWRWVSINGMPMAEFGENKEHKDWILPLLTTDDSYVLSENDDHTYQNYH